MKMYRGIRIMPGYYPVVYVDDTILNLNPSKQVVHDYGADFLEWGYHGSGPSQTAAAILLDMTGDPELAKRYHEDFKCEFIANFEQDSFALLEMQIRTWLDAFQKSEEEGL